MCPSRGSYPHSDRSEPYGSSSSYHAPQQTGQGYGQPYSYANFDPYRSGTSYDGYSEAAGGQEGQGYYAREAEHDPRRWRNEHEHRPSGYADYRSAEYQVDSRSYGGAQFEAGRYQQPTWQGYTHPQQPQGYPGYDNYYRYPTSSAEGYNNYSGYSDYRTAASSYAHPHENTSGYSDYRRPPASTDYYNREPYATQRRRSASPPAGRDTHSRGYASQARPMIVQPFFRPKSPKQTSPPPPPPPPQRTEPTEEYISVSLQPSSRLSDPSSSRKLVVLDLNGSLVLRSAHQRRAPLPRYGGKGQDGAPFDPYADPTQLRPLRAVHRRPYLAVFASYLLHDETKKWLDTMVWSSAQPHSVDDMVDRSFGERRSELKAVWARDTLGLTGDQYHKKSLTLKDLAKPWAELPSLQSSSTDKTSSSDASGTPHPHTGSSSAPTVEPSDPQRHSALTTLLVDDSPLKAMLQPWNHLVIKEYLQATRNLDLSVAAWEAARDQSQKTSEDIKAMNQEPSKEIHAQLATEKDSIREAEASEVAETAETAETVEAATASKAAESEEQISGDKTTATDADQEAPNPVDETARPDTTVSREVVMVDGEMVHQGEIVHRVVHEVVMIRGEMVNAEYTHEQELHPASEGGAGLFVPNQKRKLKKLAKKEKARLEREETEKAAFVALHKRQLAAAASRTADASVPSQEESEPSMQPQSTPPQIVQADVVEEKAPEPEMRYDETLLAVVGILDHIKLEGNVAGWLRSGGLLHTARPLEAPEHLHVAAKHGPPSRGASPSEVAGPAKRRRVDNEAEEDPAEESEADVPPPSSPVTQPPASQVPSSPISEEQELTGVPLSSPGPSSPARPEVADKATLPSSAGAPSAGLWFEDPAVLSFWADRGRKALSELNIEVESGIQTVPARAS